MSRQLRPEPGRVVRIPVGEGWMGWGRQLRGRGLIEFYDRFDSESDADQVDASALVGEKVVFTTYVADYAFKHDSSWTFLDVVPLSQHEMTVVYRWFVQDPISGAFCIYWEAPDGTWGDYPATREECAGLERAASWDPHHVEDRLRAHRNGQPNPWP